MKIAIPVSGKDQDSAVAVTFGRAAYFLIHDDATGLETILENAAMQSAGGAGIQAAQAIVDSGVQVLIAPQCGNNAAKVLIAAGIKLYKSQPDLSARGNIGAFQDKQLEELLDIHEGFHRH